jgi:hypothetical protein
MARQFREQLEEEVQIEEARKAQAAQRTPEPPPPPAAEAATEPPPPAEPPRPATFSHAHPTDESGADTSAHSEPAATAPAANADERRA